MKSIQDNVETVSMLERYLLTDSRKRLDVACRKEMKEFLNWMDEIDRDHLLSSFDLTLAWFSAKGFSHDMSLNVAIFVRDRLGGTP